MVNLLSLVLALPLVGALAIFALQRWLPRVAVAWLACSSVLGTLLASAVAVHAGPQTAVLGTWLPLQRVEWKLALDALSAVMILVITGVGFLIHVYSAAYMAEEEGYGRYFAGLNLFVFFMLLLVLAGNYAVLFAGWEGVGLASWLLIGHYRSRARAAAAATKAFLMNRLGDAALLVGLLLLFVLTGSLDIATAVERAGGLDVRLLTAALLLLTLGACGKSAQGPLFSWLPDAMEGPTPVSALIHAATMVTAGVYLLARSAPLLEAAPLARDVILYIGTFTALLAASSATAQNDIKRVLAWSTISQLGLMFMALGAGAYWAAIFHLFTHAFFKAQLFLGAGAVIHALDGEQDMRRMGGLRSRMPVTYWSMLAGACALTGLPGFAGFFSKEVILSAAVSRSVFLFAVGLSVAALTAAYMGRLMRLVFHGAPRWFGVSIHEPPLPMLAPMVLLALGSLVAGWPSEAFSRFLASTLPTQSHPGADWPLIISSLAAVTAGLWMSRYDVESAFLQSGWRVDEAYGALLQRVFFPSAGVLDALDRLVIDAGVVMTALAVRFWSGVMVVWDMVVIDGIVRYTGEVLRLASLRVRRVQTGVFSSYALLFAGGILILFGVMFYH
jgi:NADH-quinone oxidoreductase subunit L